ncbi:C-C chemokine receptor type 5-like isoform X2 [Brienomyrus brachyistius]|nr:C-C chemokine receptor type 5-like isoform X2 [Brienomyrus brachyistius]XP_048882223.1 C-C chemokine receptor type 5-like isoform X2 [Brienomyrus brachyistius]XP_048882224.1 C-C chemokine receptor type 5-like isoform X2 [Brienomyrus brachyistius]XP_048882225.1 C-C chemokine receptor type 5-like isoform X2 [Brienomyrus brachyistius]
METTTTMAYDYSDYFSDTPGLTSMLCSNGNVIGFTSVFVPTLYSLVFIFGFVGNLLVVCVVKYQKMNTMTDICLLNLAVSDLLFVISLPFWACYIAAGEWDFGNFMCKAVSFLYMMGFYGNIFFMVIMSMDRYLIIVHALTLAKHRSVRLGSVVTAVAWFVSFFASLPSMIYSQTKNESTITCKTEFPKDNVLRIFTYYELNILGFIIPLVVMTYCYAKIIPTLFSIKTNKKHRAIKLVLLIIILFFLFWTPYNFVTFLTSLKYLGYFANCDAYSNLDLSLKITEVVAFTHCCLNPVIYAFVGQKFKRLVLKLLQNWLSFCFSGCRSFSTELSERRSSVYSRSSEITSARLL